VEGSCEKGMKLARESCNAQVSEDEGEDEVVVSGGVVALLPTLLSLLMLLCSDTFTVARLPVVGQKTG
jgi:hypothetical protein